MCSQVAATTFFFGLRLIFLQLSFALVASGGLYLKTWRGLEPWYGLKKPVISKLGLCIVGLFLMTFFGFVQFQLSQGEWFMSLDNYLQNTADSDKIVPYHWLAGILFMHPFFGRSALSWLLTYLFIWRKQSKFVSVVVPNILFGLFHLPNAFASRFSVFYVALQILMGMEIGIFLSTRMLVTKSLWEGIIIHCVNNFTSSMMDTGGSSFENPVAYYSLLATVLFYFLLDTYYLYHFYTEENETPTTQPHKGNNSKHKKSNKKM